MQCLTCKSKLKDKQIKYCSVQCASKAANGKRRLERICSNCGKIEYVSNYSQMKRVCRSCSKLGNTASKNMSPESRRKISEAKKGKPSWNSGKVNIYSEAIKKSMGAKNLGKSLTDKHKAAISKSLKSHYSFQCGPNKDVKRSQDTKDKTSESLRLKRSSRIHNTIDTVIEYLKSINLNYVNHKSKQQDGFISKLDRLEVKCGCGVIYTTTINYLEFGANRTCKGCSFATSKPEQEIFEIVNDIEDTEILRNKRPQFLGGKELDIWIPEKKVAIEFHGLAHHSERPLFREKDELNVKYLHEYKYLKCNDENIKLIQIFEDEWLDKPNIVKSMIRARLGRTTKIFARKTRAEKIPKKDARQFLNNTHIAGSSNFMVSFGLYHEDTLVSVMTLRTTWNKKYGEPIVEIARFSSELNTTIVGGFSKLMKIAKIWAVEHNYKKILTYADCRFGTGAVYLKYGFLHEGRTKPNYFYEKNGKREDRFSHRKDNNPAIIEKYGSTERIQNNNQGWYAIYDAGNEIYTLTI